MSGIAAVTGLTLWNKSLEEVADAEESSGWECEPDAKSVEVVVISIQEFFLKYLPAASIRAKSSEELYRNLKSLNVKVSGRGELPLFTDIAKSAKRGRKRVKVVPFSELWVAVPGEIAPKGEEFYLRFSLRYSRADSQYLKEVDRRSMATHLHIAEYPSDSPLINLRIDREGELIWVASGEHLRGEEVNELAMTIFKEIPLVKSCTLLDSSKVLLQNAELSLALLLPLTSKEGGSWYSRSGFTPMQCKGMMTKFGAFSQEPERYRSAVEALRNRRISEMATIFASEKKRLVLLRRAANAHFSKGADPTLHELFCALHSEVKSSRALQKGCSRAEMRLLEIYSNFLDPYNRPEGEGRGLMMYYGEVDIVDEHKLWQRSFMD